ncbi:MAG: N-terminal phage integrase SAM-like domain-containing protein [Bacillota bacterium]
MSRHGYMKAQKRGVVLPLPGSDPVTRKKKYKRFTVYGSEREAKKRFREVAERLRNPETLPAGAGATVEEYLRFWLENYGETKLRPTTLANYRAIISKHIVPMIGALKLEKLSWQHLQALYRKKQQEGLSARTVRLIHAIMHRALGWASDERRRIL